MGKWSELPSPLESRTVKNNNRTRFNGSPVTINLANVDNTPGQKSRGKDKKPDRRADDVSGSAKSSDRISPIRRK